jgi:hypothetical protein
MLQQLALAGIVLFAVVAWPLLRRLLYQSSFSPADTLGEVLRVEGQRMYRVWCWAMIDRESDGRFVASIPDLWNLAAYGNTYKDAVAHLTGASGYGRWSTSSAAASVLRNAEPDPTIQERRPRHHPGGSRALGSVANSALSHVPLSPAAGNGNALVREERTSAHQSRFGPA